MITQRLFLLLFGVMLLSSTGAVAESSPNFDGEWTGTIRNIKKKDKEILIKIKGNTFEQFLKVDDVWVPAKTSKKVFTKAGDMALLGWIKDAGIGTESQVFSLSYINANQLNLIWNRHATNRRAGQDGVPFNTPGEAILTRVK